VPWNYEIGYRQCWRSRADSIRLNGRSSPVVNPELDPESNRQEAFDRLRRDIQSGIDQIDRGEVYDAEEVFEELLQGLPDPDEQES
jgi:hypothetical protein